MDQNIDRETLQRLIKEANAPLTPVEKEQSQDVWGAEKRGVVLHKIVQEILRKRKQFARTVIAQLIVDKQIPRWIADPERMEEARQWMGEHGYEWREVKGDPLNFCLAKAGQIIAKLEMTMPEPKFDDVKFVD